MPNTIQCSTVLCNAVQCSGCITSSAVLRPCPCLRRCQTLFVTERRESMCTTRHCMYYTVLHGTVGTTLYFNGMFCNHICTALHCIKLPYSAVQCSCDGCSVKTTSCVPVTWEGGWLRCAVYSMQCAVASVQCAVCSVQFALASV